MQKGGLLKVGDQVFSSQFLLDKLAGSKIHFERALDCKHTEFDDLYPYMVEYPQFFWYKRYVAWAELLTLVKVADELNLDWMNMFAPHQIQFVRQRVMSSAVLDGWFSIQDSETISGSLEQ